MSCCRIIAAVWYVQATPGTAAVFASVPPISMFVSEPLIFFEVFHDKWVA